MSVAETLDEYLDRMDGVSASEEGRAAFTVETQEQAAWAIRKLARIRAKQAEITETQRREVMRIEAWGDTERDKLQGDAEFFLTLLEGYHRQVIEADPKAKTINLPHGALKLRAQQPEISRDEVALLLWVESNRPEMVRVKRDVDWAKLKGILQFVADPERPHYLVAVNPETGERLPGIEGLERPEKFSVECNHGEVR